MLYTIYMVIKVISYLPVMLIGIQQSLLRARKSKTDTQNDNWHINFD